MLKKIIITTLLATACASMTTLHAASFCSMLKSKPGVFITVNSCTDVCGSSGVLQSSYFNFYQGKMGSSATKRNGVITKVVCSGNGNLKSFSWKYRQTPTKVVTGTASGVKVLKGASGVYILYIAKISMLRLQDGAGAVCNIKNSTHVIKYPYYASCKNFIYFGHFKP